MTAQIGETVIIDGKSYRMCACPLDRYLEQLENPPKFPFVGSHLWRGYVGHWAIVDNALYLTKLDACISLKDLFPNANGKVLADWFSGDIRVVSGKMLQYVHTGFASIFERDIMITVEGGIVTRQQIKQNGYTDDDRMRPDPKNVHFRGKQS